ncbi:MAG: hypothetical protein HOP03_17285 [Lysobacter sp.]|nr:hypothetical protein [Lysobacter sp.]
MSVVNQDTRVDITASADWEAADGNIRVISDASNKVVKTIQFAKADDYVDDVKDKVTYFGVQGKKIIVCLRYAELAPKGKVYVSPSGVVVEIIDDDGAINVCRENTPK